VHRYIDGRFVEKYQSTIEGLYEKNISDENQNIKLIITDTGGQEEHKDSATNIVTESECIIYVFSLYDKESLKFLKENIKLHKRQFHLNVPFVIAENKCDLSKDMKKVTIEQAKKN
jgi:GTPase SAR1 family protein